MKNLLPALGYTGITLLVLVLVVGASFGAHALIERMMSTAVGSCLTVGGADICVHDSGSS